MTRIADTRRWIGSHVEPLFTMVAWAAAGFILWIALMSMQGCRIFGGGGGAADGAPFRSETPTAGQGDVSGGPERGAADVVGSDSGAGSSGGGLPGGQEASGDASGDSAGDGGGASPDPGLGAVVPDTGSDLLGGLGTPDVGEDVAKTPRSYALSAVVLWVAVGLCAGFAIGWVVCEAVNDWQAEREKRKAAEAAATAAQEVKAS